MRSLFLALYTEGETDDRFLSNVVLRTVEQILRSEAEELVEVYPVVLAKVERGNGGAQAIVQAARIAGNCHILIVHLDADASKPANALSNRYEPGKQLVEHVPAAETICRTLVPIIPSRMTEAWLFADIPAVLAQIGTRMSERQSRSELKSRNIRVPGKPQQVDTIFDPKDVLDHIVRIARTSHRTTRQSLYESVGRYIDLRRLGKVPAYKQFVIDISRALMQLHILPQQDTNRDKG